MASVWRQVREAVDLLADHAPSLTTALWRLVGNGIRAPFDVRDENMMALAFDPAIPVPAGILRYAAQFGIYYRERPVRGRHRPRTGLPRQTERR